MLCSEGIRSREIRADVKTVTADTRINFRVVIYLIFERVSE